MRSRFCIALLTANLVTLACSGPDFEDSNDAPSPPVEDASTSSPSATVCEVRFDEPFPIDELPALPSDGALEARALSIRYGDSVKALRGNGALPTSAAVRQSVGASLQALLEVMSQPTNSGLTDLSDLQIELDQLTHNLVLVESVALVGPADRASAYAASTGRQYTIETVPVGADQRNTPDEGHTAALIRDSREDSDWHPTGGTVTWYKNGPAPGLLLKFWFDRRALRHYPRVIGNEIDAWEIQVNIAKECYLDLYDDVDQWIPTETNLPARYVDWNCGYPDIGSGTTYEPAAGTSIARLIAPWREPAPYYVWIPVRPRPNAPPGCDSRAIRVYSQASVYRPSAPGPIGPVPDPGNQSLLLACKVFDRDFPIPNDEPADDASALIEFTAADLAHSVEVSWARNLCPVVGDRTWGLAPCIFQGQAALVNCYTSCPADSNLCTASETCEPAQVQRGSGSIYQLGHGFTRNQTARCVTRKEWGDFAEVEFMVPTLADSEFVNIYSPVLAQQGHYSLRCQDVFTAKWSNRVYFEITAEPGECTCADQDLDSYYPPAPACTDTDCWPRSDCNDSVPSMNPGRFEICNNGIDDDCSSATSDVCAPTCTANHHQDCSDGDVYWFDSCGVRGAREVDCSTGQLCVDAGPTASCQATCTANHHQDCSDGDVYWFDSCGVRGAREVDCSTGQLCVDAGPTASCQATCTANHHQDCSDGDVYWFDSCGARGAREVDCSTGQLCVDAGPTAVCTSANSVRLVVSNIAVPSNRYVCASANGQPVQRAVPLGGGSYELAIAATTYPAVVDSIFWVSTDVGCTLWDADLWPANHPYVLNDTNLHLCVPRPENSDWRYVRGTVNADGSVVSSGSHGCPVGGSGYSANVVRVTAANISAGSGQYVCAVGNSGTAQRATPISPGTYELAIAAPTLPLDVDTIFWLATEADCSNGWIRDFWPATSSYSINGTNVNLCVPRPGFPDWRFVHGTVNVGGSVSNSGTHTCPAP